MLSFSLLFVLLLLYFPLSCFSFSAVALLFVCVVIHCYSIISITLCSSNNLILLLVLHLLLQRNTACDSNKKLKKYNNKKNNKK